MDIITTITTNLNIYNTTLTITSFLWMYFVLNRTNFVAYRNVSPWRWFWPLLLPNHMFYNEMEDYHPSSWLMMSSVYGKAVKSFHFDVEHSIRKAYKLKSSIQDKFSKTKTHYNKLNNYCKTMRPTAMASGYPCLDFVNRLNCFM